METWLHLDFNISLLWTEWEQQEGKWRDKIIKRESIGEFTPQARDYVGGDFSNLSENLKNVWM